MNLIASFESKEGRRDSFCKYSGECLRSSVAREKFFAEGNGEGIGQALTNL